jgi:hypothetical protein
MNMVRTVNGAENNYFTFKIQFDDQEVVLRVSDLLQN